MLIIYDDHIGSSYMIIIFDHHDREQEPGRDRDVGPRRSLDMGLGRDRDCTLGPGHLRIPSSVNSHARLQRFFATSIAFEEIRKVRGQR